MIPISAKFIKKMKFSKRKVNKIKSEDHYYEAITEVYKAFSYHL